MPKSWLLWITRNSVSKGSLIEVFYAEPRCGPMAGNPLHAGLDSEPPQPLVVRSPSVSLIKWPTTPIRSPSPTPNVFSQSANQQAATQANHQLQQLNQQSQQLNQNQQAKQRAPTLLQEGGGAQPVSLTALDRDCFIIPVHSVDRFLPAGVPLPVSYLNKKGYFYIGYHRKTKTDIKKDYEFFRCILHVPGLT